MNNIRKWMTLCENILPHTEEDDVALNRTMMGLYNSPRGQPRRSHLHDLGRIGQLEVATTQWPPAFRTHFFFMTDGEPVGFAILQQGGRQQTGEKYTITIIYLQPQFRNQGFGMAFYRFLMSQGIELEPDTKQSAGEVAIWKKLKENQYEFLMLCEAPLGVELPNTIWKEAANRLIDNIDWNGGGETIFYMLGYDKDEVGFEEPDTNSQEFKDELLEWAEDRVREAYNKIKGLFHGDIIHVYRMITAPQNWKPDPDRHPGDYWAWSEACADAHWGDFSNGNVKWMLEADVHSSQIDRVQHWL